MKSKVKWVIVFLLMMFLLCQAVSYWSTTPRYINVPIPETANLYWHFIERTMRIWQDSGEYKDAIFRKTGTYSCNSCSGDECCSMTELTAYFDSQLTKQEWIRHSGDSCEWLMPEMQILQNTPNSHIMFYRKREPTDWAPSPKVCLGIWPTENTTDRYEIVLVTENPSWREVFIYQFNHPQPR